jgi:hypothetical protein
MRPQLARKRVERRQTELERLHRALHFVAGGSPDAASAWDALMAWPASAGDTTVPSTT